MLTHKQQLAMSGAIAVVAVVFSSGCGVLDSLPLVKAEKTVSEEFATGDAPKIIVETFNGSIDVSPAQSNKAIVEVTKYASGVDQATADSNLHVVEVSMIQKDNEIHITATRTESHVNCGASVVIAVPAAAKLTLKTSNGPIVCERMHGGLNATSSNGKLEIVEGKGDLKLSTSNGTVIVEATDASLDARTSNGRIEFDGTLAAGDHRLRTSNGKVKLVLPETSSFKLDATTSNGHIDCDFPITSEGKSRRTRLRGTVGDKPAASISVSTSNGSIEVDKKRRDEK